MKNTLYRILDFFLPQYCVGCNKKLNAGDLQVCDDCFRKIFTADPIRLELEYDRKFKSTGYVQDFFSLYVFESEGTLQNIIHSFKYNKKFRTAILLGNKLAESLLDRLNSWQIDLIAPVPLHHLKKAERGFNQSDFIVKGLSNSSKIPYSNKIIKRIRFTDSQTKFDLGERKKNVAGAFKVSRKKKLVDKNILLVDDVITTGATIIECAKVLKKSGAAKIYVCSVAIAK
jgi:ComF family protein